MLLHCFVWEDFPKIDGIKSIFNRSLSLVHALNRIQKLWFYIFKSWRFDDSLNLRFDLLNFDEKRDLVSSLDAIGRLSCDVDTVSSNGNGRTRRALNRKRSRRLVENKKVRFDIKCWSYTADLIDKTAYTWNSVPGIKCDGLLTVAKSVVNCGVWH